MSNTPEAAPMVEVKAASKYFGERLVLTDITFSARDGEFISIVGPSGCGKTTLLRTIAGLESLSTGTVSIEGVPVSGPSRSSAMVFQSDSLLPWRTVHDNIAFGLELRKHGRKSYGDRLTDLIRLVGLEGYDKHYPRQLSGGMRQRVNLARALAVNPDVLLMDEPFAALDAYTRESMQTELLRIWAQDAKKTVIFITHQLDEAVYLSDRVIALGVNPGHILDDVSIGFERPRTISMKHSAEMGQYVSKLWRLTELDREKHAPKSMTYVK